MPSLLPPPPISVLPAVELDEEGRAQLGEGELHLWLARYEDEADEPEAALYESWMTDEERERGARFLFDKSRRQHRMTRALCRWVLSRYAPADRPIAPSEWRFERGAHGKPFVSGPEGAPRLPFNLTNTTGLIAIALSQSYPMHGLDAEWVDRRVSPMLLAKSHFAPTEHAAMLAEPEASRRERFFAYWTLKEAYIKAEGMGLAIPLDHFAFELDRGDPIGLWLAPEREDDPACWRFARFRAGAHHRLSVGVRVPPGAPLTLKVRACVPGHVESTWCEERNWMPE